jgi:hypothetical protein
MCPLSILALVLCVALFVRIELLKQEIVKETSKDKHQERDHDDNEVKYRKEV